MPRYFFNLRCPDESAIDPDGAEFANVDDAHDAAVRTARTLMAIDESDANWKECVFEIADENGDVAFELPFAEALKSSESPVKH